MSGETQAFGAYGRKRQACENCRRKKVRCDGLRPECGFCSRLGQACRYASFVSAIGESAERQAHNASSMDALYSRIARLESALQVSMADTGMDNRPISQGFFPAMPLTLHQTDPFYEQQKLSQQDPLGLIQPNTALPENMDFSTRSIEPQSLARLVDSFFLNCHNQPYSFFHEPSFRQSFALGLIPDYLLSAVAASSLRFVKDESFKGMESQIAHSLSRNSWCLISRLNLDNDDEFELGTVQATTLLTIFDFIEGKQRTAWVKLGLAARLAQALGLASEPLAELSFAEQEERRRTFWSVYLLDRLVTCGRSRPPAFDDAVCLVQLPCSEDSFRDNLPEKTQKLSTYTQSQRSRPPEPSPFARVVIVASVLSKCSQYAIQTSAADAGKPPWDVESEFQKISSALLYMESQLQFQRSLAEALGEYQTGSLGSSRSSEPILISYAMYHLCHCILNHFYLLRQRLALCSERPPQSFVRQAIQNNEAHALELSQVLVNGLEMGCAVQSSFLGYGCLISAMVHAVNRDSADPDLQQKSQQYLAFSMGFLRNGTRYWPNFVNMYDALQDFLGIANHYKPLFCFSGSDISVPEGFGEKVAYLTDYGSLSQRKSQAVTPATTADSTFLERPDTLLGYQGSQDMGETWPIDAQDALGASLHGQQDLFGI